MMEAVKPTRMEMLNLKQRLVLAQKGHKLLQQKRDALVIELFNLLKKAKDLRSQVNAAVVRSHEKLAIARAFHGDLMLEANASSAHGVEEVDLQTKNIMGVKIPVIGSISVKKSLKSRGFSVLGTSAKFDDAVNAFEEVLELVVQLAETENSFKKLLEEIEKTNRRVNALEYNVQPMLKDNIKIIRLSLERLESERVFSLKLMKKRMAKKEKAEE